MWYEVLQSDLIPINNMKQGERISRTQKIKKEDPETCELHLRGLFYIKTKSPSQLFIHLLLWSEPAGASVLRLRILQPYVPLRRR